MAFTVSHQGGTKDIDAEAPLLQPCRLENSVLRMQ
jgi:hypothetical protein